MAWLTEIVASAEFWMGLSLIAAALPGPQTRILPALFQAVGKLVAEQRSRRG